MSLAPAKVASARGKVPKLAEHFIRSWTTQRVIEFEEPVLSVIVVEVAHLVVVAVSNEQIIRIVDCYPTWIAQRRGIRASAAAGCETRLSQGGVCRDVRRRR